MYRFSFSSQLFTVSVALWSGLFRCPLSVARTKLLLSALAYSFFLSFLRWWISISSGMCHLIPTLFTNPGTSFDIRSHSFFKDFPHLSSKQSCTCCIGLDLRPIYEYRCQAYTAPFCQHGHKLFQQFLLCLFQRACPESRYGIVIRRGIIYQQIHEADVFFTCRLNLAGIVYLPQVCVNQYFQKNSR